MLQIENLDRSHGHALVLDGVSLNMEQGATIAIVGADKTSLIRTVAGMYRPTRGRKAGM